MDFTINDNDFLRQFEVKLENDLATVEYSLQEKKIFLTRIKIPETTTKDEFKSEFLSEIFKNVQERNLKVVPTSPQIASFIRKNKQYKDLLPVGIKI